MNSRQTLFIFRQQQENIITTPVSPHLKSLIFSMPAASMNHASPASSGTISRPNPWYAIHMGISHTLLMVWGTILITILCTEDHHTVVRSQLTGVRPFLCISGVILLLYAAGCRMCRRRCNMPPLLSRGAGIFCLLSFMMGLFFFLGYAWLTASYSPPDNASPNLFIPSAYTHEFSGSGLLFCLVIPLGLLSLAGSLLASSNRVPGIKDILAVLWCLLAPFLCIPLLRAQEPPVKPQSAPLPEITEEKQHSRLYSSLRLPAECS